MEKESKQPIAQDVKVSKIENPKKTEKIDEEKKALPKPTVKKINYNREKSYVKTGLTCTIFTILVTIISTVIISNARSFNQELVSLYVWICIVLFVVVLLPVFVASVIALVETCKRLKKSPAEKKNPKKIAEIMWYSLLIIAPIVITCITLTNL